MRWKSTRRGATQKVPSPSVTATRTSPDSVIGDGNAGAQQVECGRLHALDGGDDMRPFVGEARAVNVADEHGGADLPLEIVDAAAHGIDGKAKPSAAERKLPQRTTSRNTRAASQSFRLLRATFRRSS